MRNKYPISYLSNYDFTLSIDAPVCVDPSPQVVGAALDEELNVRCAVHADPGDVTFLWQFNNSGESFNVSPARYGEEIFSSTFSRSCI